MNKRSNQAGFTIVELMIATAIFAIVLLGATTAVVQIGRLYYKGIISARTQQATRSIMDEISRPVQFAGKDITSSQTSQVFSTANGQDITVNSFCIGDQRYSYSLNKQVFDGQQPGTYDNTTNRLRHGLWKNTTVPGDCTPCNLSEETPCGQGRELLDQYMRLKTLTITNNSPLYGIDLAVLYGDNDLIEFTQSEEGNMQGPIRCKGAITGAQWCALSQLNTDIVKRIQ